MEVKDLVVGRVYNWRNQDERMVYIGRHPTPSQRCWHQFELVGKPGYVWCEVLESDLDKIEVTKLH